MLHTECSIEVWERDGEPTTHDLVFPPVIVRSYDAYDKVELEIDSHRYVVLASEMKAAIQNAMNGR